METLDVELKKEYNKVMEEPEIAAAVDLKKEGKGPFTVDDQIPDSITHLVIAPTETLTFFYGKFLDYKGILKESSGEGLTFAAYLGGVVLGGLHALMEGRIPEGGDKG